MKKTHKKLNILFALLILLAGICLGGYLVLKSRNSQAGQIASILNGQTTFACQPDAGKSNQDSDNDGLKDWQEIQIYLTDPCREDSDGDGYLDGEEAASGYNPAKKAPGDKISDKALDPRPAAGTLTGELAGKIVEQMMTGQMSDVSGEVDNDKIDLLVSESFDSMIASNNTVSFIINPDTISDKEIKIIPDNSEEARIKHLLKTAQLIFDRFGAAADDNDETSRENFSIAWRAMENNDFTELDKLINNYKNSAELLKEIETPSSKKDIHKALIAYLLSCANIFEQIKLIDDDPLKAVLAIRQYNDLVKQTFEPIMKMAK